MGNTTKPRRYFWFSYCFVCTDGRKGDGENTLDCLGYFNKQWLTGFLQANISKRLSLSPLNVSIVLTNFIELNEEDYKDFTHKESQSDGS